MSDYPIDPEKLLQVAEHLAPRRIGRQRPPYMKHRRAVSTAYYAVFHAVTDRVARAAFTTSDDAFRRKVRRWIQHKDVKTVATWISQVGGTSKGSPPPHIVSLLAPDSGMTHIDSDTRQVAESFLELHEKRERADYDHDAVFTRPDTLDLLELARWVVKKTQEADTDAAERFFGLVAMQANIQNR